MQPHVLVAEDEPSIALAIEQYLSYSGYRVTVAHDGDAALQAYLQDVPDLLITDIRMPKMGGMELIQRLRTMNPALPVIIITSDMVVVEPSTARTTVFSKPFDFDKMLDAVRVSLPADIFWKSLKGTRE